MMSSLKTWPCLLPGDHGISPPGILLRFADDGRRLSSGLCDDARRRWSGSVVLRIVARSGHFGIVGRDFARSIMASALDIHMINVHLELGQLWRCPVEWCAVWKGSVSDCLGHLQDKHGGSQYVAFKNIAKFFPPWTVLRDLWKTALRLDVSGIAVDARLFHEARCH